MGTKMSFLFAFLLLCSNFASKKKRMEIALLASGGVDSAVATHLMVERGEHPTLFYIKIGDKEDEEFTCSMEEDLEMVNMLAKQYDLKVETVDLHKDYWENVISYLVDRVKRGLTPNPDVMCNSLIKFGCFYDKVGKDFDVTVTGHYATTLQIDGTKFLATAKDPVKDQTDFLCQITPAQLSKLTFPVGSMMKSEVRAIAEKYGLAPAHRRDSQGICFLGNTNYNALLRRYLGEREGDIIEWETRKKLGKHQGYWFYTIGQRKGLRLGGGPWFVVHKDIKKNRVYVSKGSEAQELLCERFYLADFHSIATDKPDEAWKEKQVFFKIRHSPEFETGRMKQTEQGFCIQPEKAMPGVAPGQFAVVYLPYNKSYKICLGSGEIASTEIEHPTEGGENS
jgi:tRNA-specific 2-thiouridylase